MEANEEVEIPFGAKDSELKAWEYTIPEGMEAEIKDGKIIVREKESEDERIRKDWSEEDEKMLQGTINSLMKYQLSMPNFLVELQMRWLKSLKDRALWKPSDEQMEYLAKAMAMDEADKRKDILQNERELNSDAFTKEVSADNQALLDAAKEYKERTPFQFPNQLQPAYEAFIAGAQWQKQYWDKVMRDNHVEMT